MAKKITCQSPLHGSRKNLNDGREWRDDFGTYSGVLPPPCKCERCAFHDQPPAAPDPDEVLQKVAASCKVTPAELRALLGR